MTTALYYLWILVHVVLRNKFFLLWSWADKDRSRRWLIYRLLIGNNIVPRKVGGRAVKFDQSLMSSLRRILFSRVLIPHLLEDVSKIRCKNNRTTSPVLMLYRGRFRFDIWTRKQPKGAQQRFRLLSGRC